MELSTVLIILGLGFPILLLFFIGSFRKWKKREKELKEKLAIYQPLIDLDKEAKERRDNLSAIQVSLSENAEALREIRGRVYDLMDLESVQKTIEKYKQQKEELYSRIQRGKEELQSQIDSLQKNLESIQEKDELSSFAFFDKIYDFETSVEYDQAMKANRDKQKEMIKAEEAVEGDYSLTFNGSLAQGKKIVKSNIKVIVRAFNGECDACVSSVKWNNLETMQNRIGRSYEQLNKIAQKMNCQITPAFLKIKLEELKLMQEFLNQKQVEKEEQIEIRARMREEEQVRREIEKAEKDAEKEIENYTRLLEKARAEIQGKTGDQLVNLEVKVALLTKQLEESQAKKERALSMAQQTRAGHVYVISNIGAFGENVYKVGMTRRVEPELRIRELSDASVPFNFDIHAMIWSKDAVALEKTMHKHLWKHRINRVNERREFFAVNWEEIESAFKEVHGVEVKLTKAAKAFEYRQSLAMRETEEKAQSEEKVLMDA